MPHETHMRHAGARPAAIGLDERQSRQRVPLSVRFKASSSRAIRPGFRPFLKSRTSARACLAESVTIVVRRSPSDSAVSTASSRKSSRHGASVAVPSQAARASCHVLPAPSASVSHRSRRPIELPGRPTVAVTVEPGGPSNIPELEHHTSFRATDAHHIQQYRSVDPGVRHLNDVETAWRSSSLPGQWAIRAHLGCGCERPVVPHRVRRR